MVPRALAAQGGRRGPPGGAPRKAVDGARRAPAAPTSAHRSRAPPPAGAKAGRFRLRRKGLGGPHDLCSRTTRRGPQFATKPRRRRGSDGRRTRDAVGTRGSPSERRNRAQNARAGVAFEHLRGVALDTRRAPRKTCSASHCCSTCCSGSRLSSLMSIPAADMQVVSHAFVIVAYSCGSDPAPLGCRSRVGCRLLRSLTELAGFRPTLVGLGPTTESAQFGHLLPELGQMWPDNLTGFERSRTWPGTHQHRPDDGQT